MAARCAAVFAAVALGCLVLAQAQTPPCETTFSQVPDSNYTTCLALPENGAKLAWNWENATRLFTATFVHRPEAPGGWVAWGINHNDSLQMAKSSCLACFPDKDSGAPVVKQYFLANTEMSGVNEGGELDIVSKSCVIDSGIHYLTFQLNLGKKAKLYQIYGGGPGVVKVDSSQYNLMNHNPATNIAAFIDVRNVTQIIVVRNTHTTEKNLHGSLNAVGWGILLPLGAMIARYLKPFADPAWFYLHIVLQISGYAIGTVGFGYGLKLREWSTTDRSTHFTLGVIVFALATLQVLGGFARPQKESSLRVFFNIGHFTGGLTAIILAAVNNFVGFHILVNYGNWRMAYIVAISILGGLAVILEVVTWFLYVTRKPVPEEEQLKVKAANGAAEPEEAAAR